MKKRLFAVLGVLCSFGYFSCTKTSIKESAPADLVNQVETSRRHPNCGCDPALGSTIFDSTCIVATNAQLQTLGTGFSFTEGPAVDKHGNIFFTDQPNDKIYKWAANTGVITTFLTGTDRSNGMYFDKDGFLITCADMHGQVWSIAPNGHHKVLVDKYNNKLLNGPNDIWINPRNGGMYITDPLFGRDYWDANDPRKVNYWPGTSQQALQPGSLGGYVYYLSPNRKRFTRVATEAIGWSPEDWVNGVVGTPDGKKLYVNKWAFNTDVSKTFVFDIRPDGTLSNMRLFTNMGGDGMTMDERGNVYIANNHGITAFDKHGTRILNIPVPPGGSNNVVFGGRDGKTLFITGQDKVYALKMKVRGADLGDDDHDHGHH